MFPAFSLHHGLHDFDRIWPRTRILVWSSWTFEENEPVTVSQDWFRILTDPDPDELERMLNVGQVVTWPKVRPDHM